jgi:hypothetical protein
MPSSFTERVGNTLTKPFARFQLPFRRQEMTSAPRRHVCYGIKRRYPYDNTIRTMFGENEASIYAWSSRGGVIILNKADAVDFEFIGINPLDPPLERMENQEEEESICQRLLLLGAKWWDSEARYSIIDALEKGESHAGERAFVIGDQPPATMREKRFVKVAWPSTGGIWVSEFDTVFAGVDEEDNLLEESPSRLQMARSMDERSAVMRKHFNAKFYNSIEEYEGHAFLKAWQENNNGEVGPRLQADETKSLWNEAIRLNTRSNPKGRVR